LEIENIIIGLGDFMYGVKKEYRLKVVCIIARIILSVYIHSYWEKCINHQR
jgi:hypothetical protein